MKSFIGKVIHGRARGRTIGFPTANLKVLENQSLPDPGVYAADVWIRSHLYHAIVDIHSISLAPEVHIINYSGDLYGVTLEIDPIQFIRDEIIFMSIEDVKLQSEADIQQLQSSLICTGDMSKYKNCIAIHPGAISPKLCKTVIDFFDNNKNFDSAIVQNEVRRLAKGMRNSKEILLQWKNPETNALVQKLKDIINPLVVEYFEKYPALFADVGDTHYEPGHILKYEVDEGFYKYHIDSYGMGLESRILSIIIYLNDVEVGGETEFQYMDIDPVKPKRGNIMIFPSTRYYIHRGNVPISNEKYVCTFWLIRE